jgi:uncharacterized protein
MIQIGQNNTLRAARNTVNGIYLSDDTGNEVLLPNSLIPEGLSVNDFLDVFIYNDSEDRIVATTLTPKIKLNEFALLRVNAVSGFGAFMDWGLPKDLLVPFSEQPNRFAEGEWHLVCLYLDEKTNRLAGSANIEKFLDNSQADFNPGDEVGLIVYRKTNLGFNVIINNQYSGLLFRNEIFQPIEIGYATIGFIKKLRDDKKIDVSLHRFGYRNIAPNSEKILALLKQHDGFMSITDKSSPQKIAEQFGMSKKTFKKAIGDLYKQRVISIEPGGIRMI